MRVYNDAEQDPICLRKYKTDPRERVSLSFCVPWSSFFVCWSLPSVYMRLSVMAGRLQLSINVISLLHCISMTVRKGYRA